MHTGTESRLSNGSVLLRSLGIGLVYALASFLIAFILGPFGRLAPAPGNLLVWFISGSLMALSLAPFMLHSSWSPRHSMLAAWAVMVFVRSLGLGIEGSLFKPAQAGVALVGAAVGILLGLLVAWLAARWLAPSAAQARQHAGAAHSLWGWIWRILVVGLAYFVFYFVFGAANALLYTRPFYENNPQYGLSLPPAGIIFLAQLLRGPLFGLGSLFIVRAADAPRSRLAVWLGILLFVVGGLGPYLETTFRTMPLGFNLATLLEILLQNFLTGVVAVTLFTPGKKRLVPARAS